MSTLLHAPRLAVLPWPRARVGVIAAVALAAAGAAAGALLALRTPPAYVSEATMLVSRGGELPRSSEAARQAALTVAALAESASVAGVVGPSLKLDESPAELRAAIEAAPASDTGTIDLRVRQPNADLAQRVAQETALDVSQLVRVRLGRSGLAVSVWDPASKAVAVRRAPLPWALAGALVGLLLAGAVALGLRAVVRRAQTVEPPVPAAPEPEPEPESEPAPEPAPEPVRPAPRVDDPRSLARLEELVARADATPERREEWQVYLVSLREVADADGLLPPRVDPLVHDVFGELL